MSAMDEVGSDGVGVLTAGALSVSYRAVGVVGGLSDFFLIVFSSVGVDALYQWLTSSSVSVSHPSLAMGAIVSVFFVLLGRSKNFYKLNHMLEPQNYYTQVLLIWALSILLATAVLFLMRAGTIFSRGSTAIFAVLTGFVLLLAKDLISRGLRALIAQGVLSGSRVVVVGENSELGQLTSSSLLVDFGLTEVQRISLRDDGEGTLAVADVARLRDAIARGRERNVEEFVLACAWNKSELIDEVSALLRRSPLPVRLLPDRYVRPVLGRGRMAGFATLAMVELQRAPLSPTEQAIKRVCDFVFALAILGFLAPVMLISALLIAIDSPGPIIFRQRRTGFDGRKFTMYKFRTMRVMEDGEKIVQTKKNDPRVTRAGRLLRKSSIDELPQLLNVLRGEMSLVGPRPHALAHDDHYGSAISKYADRQHVKPGITGWAQVNGYRGETRHIEDMERRVELDLWYVDNWSIALDLKILWRTCFEVVSARAY